MPYSRKTWDPRQKGDEADFYLFMDAYVEAALWSSMDEEGLPLYGSYSAEDIEPATGRDLERAAREFIRQNWELIKEDLDRAGRDFWFTQNRHGAGFWDGDWPKEVGASLTKSAYSFGGYNLLVGNDGKLYGVSG